MNIIKHRVTWVAALIVAYLISGLFWAGATLNPLAIPQTIYYAPTGLLKIFGFPVELIPDPRPEVIYSILPWIHLIFWSAFFICIILLPRISDRWSKIAFGTLAVVLISDLIGCAAIAH